MIYELHRGSAHLFASSAAGRGLGLRLLTIVLPEAGIHIVLNRGGVLENVGENSFLDCPPEEVQLAHRGLLNRRRAGRLEADPVATAERVKQTFGVGLEFAFVLEMDDELLAIQRVADIELLGVVGDEPFYHAEADGSAAVEEGCNLRNASGCIVELLEPADNELLFALDAGSLLGGAMMSGVHLLMWYLVLF